MDINELKAYEITEDIKSILDYVEGLKPENEFVLGKNKVLKVSKMYTYAKYSYGINKLKYFDYHSKCHRLLSDIIENYKRDCDISNITTPYIEDYYKIMIYEQHIFNDDVVRVQKRGDLCWYIKDNKIVVCKFLDSIYESWSSSKYKERFNTEFDSPYIINSTTERFNNIHKIRKINFSDS